LVPIHSGGHWTLLVVIFDGEARVSSYRYYETLDKVKPCCMQFAQKILQLFDLQVQLPLSRSNVCAQTGSSCGYWILYYSYEEARESLGEGRGGGSWPTEGVKSFKKQFLMFISNLRQELEKFSNEQKSSLEKSSKVEAGIQKKISPSALKAKLDLLDAELSAKAQELILHDPLYEQGLSSENILHLQSLQRHSPGVCSRCRWSHGCLSCDWRKARIFYLKKIFKDQELQKWKAASASTLLKGVIVDSGAVVSSSSSAASCSSSSSSASSSSSSSSASSSSASKKK
jgi:hypothetical protein